VDSLDEFKGHILGTEVKLNLVRPRSKRNMEPNICYIQTTIEDTSGGDGNNIERDLSVYCESKGLLKPLSTLVHGEMKDDFSPPDSSTSVNVKEEPASVEEEESCAGDLTIDSTNEDPVLDSGGIGTGVGGVGGFEEDSSVQTSNAELTFDIDIDNDLTSSLSGRRVQRADQGAKSEEVLELRSRVEELESKVARMEQLESQVADLSEQLAEMQEFKRTVATQMSKLKTVFSQLSG